MHTCLKYFVTLFLATTTLSALPKESSFYKHKVAKTKIAVNNIPLAKINGKVISLGDVVKELDLRLYSHNPDAYNDVNHRFSYYRETWKRQLDELISLELLKKEAEEKKVKISDSDIRKELIDKYGSDLITKLSQANLTYEDAKESVRNDILAQQMNWFGFINKVFYKVGPQTLKTAYDEHLANNPATQLWKYQFLTIRHKNKDKAAEIGFKLKALDPKNFSNLQALKEALVSLFSADEEFRISITDDFNVEDKSIAESHKTILATLPIETISEPVFQQTNNEFVIRLFHLKDFIKSEPEPFHQMSDRLKGELVSRMAEKERLTYFQRLKEKYGYSNAEIYLPLPTDYEPFSLREG